MEKQTDTTKSKGSKTVVVKKWYWYIGLMTLIYLFTIGIFQFWLRIPLEIAKDPPFGLGRLVGLIGVVWFSIWLMRKGKKVN